MLDLYYAALLITLRRIAITAITNKTWIKPPTFGPNPLKKKPIIHNITNTTATR